jgi:hypothetical protein
MHVPRYVFHSSLAAYLDLIVRERVRSWGVEKLVWGAHADHDGLNVSIRWAHARYPFGIARAARDRAGSQET